MRNVHSSKPTFAGIRLKFEVGTSTSEVHSMHWSHGITLEPWFEPNHHSSQIIVSSGIQVFAGLAHLFSRGILPAGA